MENERHYFIVGLFVFLVLACSSIFVVWMLSHSGQGKQTPYVIYFDHAINGVSVGSQVRLRGIPVGTISSIAFDPDNARLIRVLTQLSTNAPIDGTTRATVQLQGVTGQAVIALNNKDNLPQGSAQQELSRDRDGLPIIPSEPSQLEQVFDKLPGLVDDIRELTQRGQNLLSDENIESFHDTLTSFSNAAQTAERTMQSLGTLSNKGQNFFSDDNNAELREVLTEGKLTLREVRFLAKSLRDDPSQVIYRPSYGGYKPDEGGPGKEQGVRDGH